jgi:hypothetical protein
LTALPCRNTATVLMSDVRNATSAAGPMDAHCISTAS